MAVEVLCGSQSWLKAAFQAAFSALAICANEPLLRTWRGHSCLQRCHSCRRSLVGHASACPVERSSTCSRVFLRLRRFQRRRTRSRREPGVSSARPGLWPFVRQAILPVRTGLRPMQGDESLAEVHLSRTSFDAPTVGRVADRLNGKSEAFDRAGGLSGRLLIDTRRISRASQWDACETRSRRNSCELREWSVRRRPERPPAGTIACHTRRPPACHERLVGANGQKPGASSARRDKLKHVLPKHTNWRKRPKPAGTIACLRKDNLQRRDPVCLRHANHAVIRQR